MTCEFLTSRDVRRKLFDILFWNHGVIFFSNLRLYILCSCIYIYIHVREETEGNNKIYIYLIVAFRLYIYLIVAFRLYIYLIVAFRLLPNITPVSEKFLAYIMSLSHTLFCHCFVLISYLRLCVCKCIVVSNTYCVVFLFCLFSSCVPYAASFSGLSIFDCPFGILWRIVVHTCDISIHATEGQDIIFVVILKRVNLEYNKRGI